MSLVATRICTACVLFAKAGKLMKHLFCAYKRIPEANKILWK